MGRLERTMRRKQEKAEKILPNELADLKMAQRNLAAASEKSQEAQLVAAECQTLLDYTVMQLRHKYDLKVGDNISPDDGKINRA